MREHILTVAEHLFYEEGIRAIGVDRIVSEAGVAKATLYRHFPGKSDLVEAYLRNRHERIIATLSQALGTDDSTALPPRDRILYLFDLLEEKASTPPFRGCAFLIAVAENEASQPVISVARNHKQAVRAIIENIATALPVNASLLSDQIALCYEGALASIAVQRTPVAARIAKQCASVLIDAALQQSKDSGPPP